VAFDQYSEPQSRRAEIGAGLSAIAAGLFALGFAVWLPAREGFHPALQSTVWIAAVSGLLGCYLLVLARRLLTARRQRHLVSPFVMLFCGAYLGVGAVLVARYEGSSTFSVFEGLVLAGAFGLFALRQYRQTRKGGSHPDAT